jgi:hypothetical protein
VPATVTVLVARSRSVSMTTEPNRSVMATVRVGCSPSDTTVADNRHFVPDLTNKKLLVLTAVNTQATDTSDQSAVTGVQLLVVGY